MNSESSARIKNLTDTLNQYRRTYYNSDAPLVSDDVYDRLYDELLALEQTTGLQMANSPTATVGFIVVGELDKAVHEAPLLSLEKTKSVRELVSFAGGRPILLMLKLDGLTVKLEYEDGQLQRASTRGDGNVGEVITHNARGIANIPAVIQYRQRLVVTGEAFIAKGTFERLKSTLVDSTGNPYRNPRNMAAGAVRNYDSRACAQRQVRFTAFSVLEGFEEDDTCANSKASHLDQLNQLGFSVCRHEVIEQPDEVPAERAIARLKADAESWGIPIDGIVATYDDISFSRACGRTGHHYKDGLALKFEDELYGTVFRGIEWTPSRTGELAPVAQFDMVVIDGCEVSRASLHNLSFIKELELHPGCRILISKRNMIIPHVEENLDKGHMDNSLIPAACSCCGSPTRVQTSDRNKAKPVETLHCDNPSCASQKLRKFVHFVSKKAMDIEGLSEATLERFIDAGYLNTFMDVYRLNEHADEIMHQMKGFGTQSFMRLWDAIQRSRNTTFERYVIAMDIPMVGRTASGELCRHFSGSLETFESAVDSGYDFTTLPDFGETLHRNIHSWFQDEENRNTWEELQKMLNVKNETTMPAVDSDNPFAGRTIVVTGKLQLFTRSEINAKIESLGGKAGSAVSKNTDFLICGEKAGSKLANAQKLGIRILSEQQFLEMASA